MKQLLVAAILAASLLTAGCKQDTGTQLAVTYAAMKYIEGAGDAQAQAERAGRVRAIAEQVQALAKGESVTIAALLTYVTGKLPSDLSPADRMLATALIGVVATELEGRVGAGVLDPDKLLVVDKLLGYVIGATAYFPPA